MVSPNVGFHDGELDLRKRKRVELAMRIERELGPFNPLFLQALIEVDRHRFVRPQDEARAEEDTPLPLDDEGLATISAPHAYLLTFRLAELSEGFHVVELGTGSGYGAALAAFIVGRRGRVRSFEIDPKLARWASGLLAIYNSVRVACEDAVASPRNWGPADRVLCTFAVRSIPSPWLDALGENAILVAPVGDHGQQRLVRVTRVGGRLIETTHGAVRYVGNRSRSAP